MPAALVTLIDKDQLMPLGALAFLDPRSRAFSLGGGAEFVNKADEVVSLIMDREVDRKVGHSGR